MAHDAGPAIDSSARNRSKKAQRWLWIVLATTLAAFVLRVVLIDEQSLRGDEALSAIYAQKSLPEIIEITRFVSGHPPLFYSMLHFWQRAAGGQVFAVRFFALWWGVLCVPLCFSLGKRLLGMRAGLWAALLMAMSPFHIWHSQDARAYSMLAALALASSLALYRALLRSSKGNWAVYALLALLLVYTHYFGAFLVAAHGVFFVWERWRNRGGWISGAMAFASVGLLLLPWPRRPLCGL